MDYNSSVSDCFAGNSFSTPPIHGSNSMTSSRDGSLSRRQFQSLLAAAVGGTACVHLPLSSTAWSAATNQRFNGWPIGIQSYSLRAFDFDQAIRHMQGLGLHYVECYSKHVPVNATDEQLARIKQKLESAGVQMTSHGVNGFTSDHDANRKVFDFARRAGLKNITANPRPDSFDSLDKLVAEYDIRVCIHNHGPGSLYDSIDDVVVAIKDHDKR